MEGFKLAMRTFECKISSLPGSATRFAPLKASYAAMLYWVFHHRAQRVPMVPLQKLLNPWRIAAQVIIGINLGAFLIFAYFGTGEGTLRTFNLAEGLFWIGIGLALLWRSRSLENLVHPALFAGVIFLLFAVSDFIEMRTGSWFEPTWLMIWNLACVLTLIACFFWYRRLAHRRCDLGS